MQCAPGQKFDGVECVTEARAVRCGAGTREEVGVCIPDTHVAPNEEDGQNDGSDPNTPENASPDSSDSEPDPEPIRCGPGTVLEQGQCVAQRSLMRLPFPEGTDVPVGQGSHGHFSHKGTSTYAIDFTVPEGTLVVAAREGRVLATRSDSDVECDGVSCLHDANYVVVDHGDGTTARYWHLQQEGVLVEPGDTLCAGDLIGLSGNTGFSAVPHLHFVVKDLCGHSVPLLFHDVTESGVLVWGIEPACQ